MTKTIRLLDDHTINKIAAGEVIENPSSVVKELIDNALDAKATEITIDIKQGGRTLIRVQDNGIGMSRDDALLSLERHATSKIQDVDDLFTIDTMGFRGEAIPSIAAISRFTLHTMKAVGGTFLTVEGGKLLSVEERERPQGTAIEVKDLFFNVPVRRKFQKSPTYDANEILKMVMRLSLANPSISFELTSDNEVTLKTKADSLKERIKDVLGNDFLEEAISIDVTVDDMTLRGFLGLPLASKPNRLSQHLFINRRPVFSPFIAESIRESYGSALPQGRFPIFVLQLSAPKDLIDINVHPQKKEVRLRHFEQFKSAIGKSVQEALFGKKPSLEVNRSSFIINSLPLEERPKFIFQDIEDEIEEPKPIEVPLFTPKREFQLLFVSHDIAILKGGLKNEEEALFTLIDIKSVKETVLFSALKEKKMNELTPFLIPYVFTLARDEALILKENIPHLEEKGISIREFHGESFCLEALPTAFGTLDAETFIKDIVAGLKIEEFCAKKVVSSIMRSSSEKRTLSHAEVIYLIISIGDALFSPSGKPLYISLDAIKAKKVIATCSA